MSKYITKSGQNLYDVALTLYGSIEGIFDLLLSNSDISFNTVFSKGMELEYHESFIINQDIANWFDTNSIKVKNGCYNIISTDVRTAIINWIADNNSKIADKYHTGALLPVSSTDDTSSQSFDWDIQNTKVTVAKMQANATTSNIANIQTTPFISQNKWESQNVDIKQTTALDNIIAFAQTLSNIKLETLNTSDLAANLDVMFSNGMIVLPTDEMEKQLYYDTLATPKIIIQQTGKNSTIGMQIPSNSFIAISWGDNTDLDFYCYSKNVINAMHTYTDAEEHAITIYGDNKFTNLDFTKINGIYYALAEIYISNDFTSLYQDETTLNKLFIKKTVQ